MKTSIIIALMLVVLGSVMAENIRVRNNHRIYDLQDNTGFGSDSDLLNGRENSLDDNVNLNYKIREGQDEAPEDAPKPLPVKRAPIKAPLRDRRTTVNDILDDKADSYGQVGHLKSNFKRYVGGVNNKDVDRAGWGALNDPTLNGAEKSTVVPAQNATQQVADDEGDNLNDDDFRLSDSDASLDDRKVRHVGLNNILEDKADSYGQVGHLKSNFKRYVGGVNNKDVSRAGWGAKNDPQFNASLDTVETAEATPAQKTTQQVSQDDGDDLDDDDLRFADHDDDIRHRRRHHHRVGLNNILEDKADSYGQVGHLKSNWKRYVGGVNNKDVSRAGWGAENDPRYTTFRRRQVAQDDD